MSATLGDSTLLQGWIAVILSGLLAWIQRRMQWLTIRMCRMGPIPRHVAFIMDGNRRFAKQNRLSRTVEGHVAGFDGLQATMEWCYELGVETVTVYAFSIENFNRSPEEVSTLMELAIDKFHYMLDRSELVSKYGVQIRVLGELEMLPEDVRMAVNRAMTLTKDNQGPIVNICFPYTARAELTTVANNVLDDLQSGKLCSSELDPVEFSKRLYTNDCAPVEILVRTSGERRLSEFLNWQVCSGRAHIEFLDLYWPAFRFHHFLPILLRFQLRRLYNIVL